MSDAAMVILTGIPFVLWICFKTFFLINVIVFVGRYLVVIFKMVTQWKWYKTPMKVW